jgi:hypothetical protein
MKTLSTAQLAALAAIVAQFDAENARNVALWGKSLAGRIAVDGLGLNPRTVRALADTPYIDWQAVTHTGSVLRRGAYGRWIGGAKTVRVVSTYARPTDAGRAYLAAVA